MWKKLAWDPLCMSTSGIYYPNGSLVVQYQEEKVAEFTEADAKESQIMSSFAVRVSDYFGVCSKEFQIVSAFGARLNSSFSQHLRSDNMQLPDRS
ncbi:unnamed protein product [Sphagnum troendelagicum]